MRPSGKKRILITNDDGISAPGLIGLVEEVRRRIDCELFVVAPVSQQSAQSHALSINKPIYAESVRLASDTQAEGAWQVSGTPADCVKLALTALVKDRAPDLVLSGINAGYNHGTIAIYSGTVAGAREACLNQIPAVALSLQNPADGMSRVALAAELFWPVIDAVLAEGLPKNVYLNVNMPNRPREEIQGLRFARQSYAFFKEWFEEEAPEGNKRKFLLEGSLVEEGDDPSLDHVALREGFIAVTPLGLLNSQFVPSGGRLANTVLHWENHPAEAR